MSLQKVNNDKYLYLCYRAFSLQVIYQKCELGIRHLDQRKGFLKEFGVANKSDTKPTS